MNFDLVRLRENYYKMFVKIVRKALIPDGNVSKLCFSVDQTLFFDLDGIILQRLEGRNEILDEMFVCFLCIEALHEESRGLSPSTEQTEPLALSVSSSDSFHCHP